MNKLAAALLSLVWLSACSFPDFAVTPVAGAPEASCHDDERNGDETGIDCGMAACGRACAAGQGCSADADCDGGACRDDVCRAESCEDGLQNADESDVDCGGEQGCARCSVDQRCATTTDCDGGLCASGQCRAATCKDDLLNADETDVDCGGDTCLPCAVGQMCSDTEDCDGVACGKNECQPAACDDDISNQDETDLDCGGSCPSACADGLRCKVGLDCESGVCPKQTLRCAAPSCDDGVLNGSEPTPDCGASCSDKCQVLDACRVAADCDVTTSCSNLRCLPSSATGQALSPVQWTATASHTFGNSDPKLAIDGIKASDWTTGEIQTPGMWFLIDMQADQVFFSIEIDCINARDDSAAALDISFSTDGEFTDPPAKQNYPGEDQIVITFANPQVARYIKISLAQGADHWWRMDEIRVRQ